MVVVMVVGCSFATGGVEERHSIQMKDPTGSLRKWMDGQDNIPPLLYQLSVSGHIIYFRIGNKGLQNSGGSSDATGVRGGRQKARCYGPV